jgi:hypothetical protein
MPQTLLGLDIFQIGSHIYVRAGLECSPPIYTSQVAGMTVCITTPGFFLFKIGSHELFTWTGLGNAILQISAFLVGGIMPAQLQQLSAHGQFGFISTATHFTLGYFGENLRHNIISFFNISEFFVVGK